MSGMSISRAVDVLGRFGHLQEFEAQEVMNVIMRGEASPSQIGAYLMGLRMKGETIDEIVGSARALRTHACPVEVAGRSELIDTCGTGGDQSGTFNVSTSVAFVAAAAGLKVAKHGNRASSSRCGSADVLEALGANIELGAQGVAHCIAEVGIGFMFAPLFHPAMKTVAPIRRDLRVRTIFNVLGPLVNPAAVERQLLGVFAPDLTDTIAHVLQRLGCRFGMVVSGYGGIDELTTTGLTHVSELRDGQVHTFDLDPRSLKLRSASVLELEGGSAEENATTMREILSGRIRDARRDIVLLNSAAALYVGRKTSDLSEGIALAGEMIESGAAATKLDRFIECSRSVSP